jgi:lipopolysaccharide transport system permease protein
VTYRDVRYLIPFLSQLWLFATPSAYSRPTAEPDTWMHVLLVVNPMSGLIAAFRAAMLNEPISWDLLGTAAVAAIAVFVAGVLYFRKVEDTFADTV